MILATSAAAAASTVTGFQIAFWWTVGFSAVALVVSFLLPGRATVAAATGSVPTRVEAEVAAE